MQHNEPEPAEKSFRDAAARITGLYADLASTEKKLANDVAALEAQLKQQSEEAKRMLEASVGVFWRVDEVPAESCRAPNRRPLQHRPTESLEHRPTESLERVEKQACMHLTLTCLHAGLQRAGVGF